jgi:hypothetical protein
VIDNLMADRRDRKTSPSSRRAILRTTRSTAERRGRSDADGKSDRRDRSPLRRSANEPVVPRGSGSLITNLNVISSQNDSTDAVVNSAMAWAQQSIAAESGTVMPELQMTNIPYGYEDVQYVPTSRIRSPQYASANFIGPTIPVTSAYYDSSMAIGMAQPASLMSGMGGPVDMGMDPYSIETMPPQLYIDANGKEVYADASGMLMDPSMGTLHTLSMPLYEAHAAEIHPGILNREIIRTEDLVLHPPASNNIADAQPRTLREKPAGCKTVFVGGIPEKSTEENIKEIFEK